MGCRYCMQACPFQIPTYQWNSVVPIVQKCIMCYDKVSKGEPTACAAICPTGATAFGFRDDLLTEAHKRIQDNPTEYQNQVYGEKEVGGTSVLMLSKVPFVDLGLKPNPSVNPLPKLTWNVLSETPNFALGWGIFLGGMWWLTNRKNEMQEKVREELKKKAAEPIEVKLPPGIFKLTFWKSIFLLTILAGLAATFMRVTHGLGSTHLTDEIPWGLWVGFKLCAVALAAGGFTLCAITHIFHIKRYEPLVRPAVLIAFLGYLSFIVTLLYDLGQPWRIWHPLLMWNEHSVMFEVSWCVMLYTTVLALEFSPILFERLGWHTPMKWIHTITIPLVIFGVVLSTLHQSSLGSMYLIVPGRLHPLWYSPMIPVFFFISALGAGCAMLMFGSFLSYRNFGKRLHIDLLGDLAKMIIVIETIYLIVRVQDLFRRGAITYLYTLNLESGLFMAELLIGTILPIIILSFPAVRKSQRGLYWTSVLIILGMVLNRGNISITGIQAFVKTPYFPSWTEIAIVLAVASTAITAFTLAVKYLPIFEELEDEPKQEIKYEQFKIIPA